MRGEIPRHVFSGVDVGLPSKVRGSEAEEEWQEVDWVTWSTGELTVDADSFLLVFKPSGGTGSVKGKPLGSMIRASAVSAADEEARTFVVTTSDGLNRLYRLTFQSGQHVTEFTRLAAAAEANHAAMEGTKDPSRGDDMATGAKAKDELEAEIREALSSRCPLIFGGVELFGPDPAPQSGGSEVLIGHGAVVLLDPPEDSKNVGAYELVFYGEDEGAKEPVKCMQIGPKMVLTKQQPEAEDEDGPEEAFALAVGPQGLTYTITFESAHMAACFARDFHVRQRLMEISLKTAKRGNKAQELRSEIETLKRQSLGARLQRLVCLCILLLMSVALARLGMLYAKDKGAKPPAAYLTDFGQDVALAVQLSRTKVAAAGVQACELAFGSVSADDVRRCAALASGAKSVSRIVQCLEALAGPR